MFNFNEFFKALLPKGDAWQFRPFGHFDNIVDGLASFFQDRREELMKLASTRDPEKTALLSDLEREYGVLPSPLATEEDRRRLLGGAVYMTPGFGATHLEKRLHAAGFTQARVFQNHIPINPNDYLQGAAWSMVHGHEDAVHGHRDAYHGRIGVGGYLVVNGPVTEPGETELAVWTVSSAADAFGLGRWHLVFIIGAAQAPGASGWFVVQDGDMERMLYGPEMFPQLLPDSDMEDEDVIGWYSSGGSAITKELGTYPGGIGARVLQAVNTVGADASVSLTGIVSPELNYTYSVWVKINQVTPQGTWVQLDIGGVRFAQHMVELLDINTWVQMTGEFYTPSATPTLLVYSYGAIDDETIQVDNFEIRRSRNIVPDGHMNHSSVIGWQPHPNWAWTVVTKELNVTRSGGSGSRGLQAYHGSADISTYLEVPLLAERVYNFSFYWRIEANSTNDFHFWLDEGVGDEVFIDELIPSGHTDTGWAQYQGTVSIPIDSDFTFRFATYSVNGFVTLQLDEFEVWDTAGAPMPIGPDMSQWTAGNTATLDKYEEVPSV